MSWLVLTIASAFLLGFYDYFKKLALRGNAVMPVLFGRICAGAMLWLPFMRWSAIAPGTLPIQFLHVTGISSHDQFLLLMKAVLVGASWLCGYIGIKSPPLSIATPIRATGPPWTILFAGVVFHGSPAARPARDFHLKGKTDLHHGRPRPRHHYRRGDAFLTAVAGMDGREVCRAPRPGIPGMSIPPATRRQSHGPSPPR